MQVLPNPNQHWAHYTGEVHRDSNIGTARLHRLRTPCFDASNGPL